MNEYFQKAQEAFKNGDKKLAKELSLKGREHQQKMEAYKKAAMEQIAATVYA